MANNKDFIVKNAVEVGGATKVTVGDAATGGSYTASWQLDQASYDSVSFNASSQVTVAADIVIGSNGTKMYLLDVWGSATYDLHQYTLSTAYDVSTASYDGTSKTHTFSEDSEMRGFFFKDDGTKLVAVGDINATLYQYSLSTAWDISTISYDSKSLLITGGGGSAPEGVFMKADGTEVYICNVDSGEVSQYTLSTAWDISTGTYQGKFNATGGSVYGGRIKSDGLIMWLDETSQNVREYSLSTAFDITTASATGNVYNFTSQDSTGTAGIEVKPDGTKLYIFGNGTDDVFQYTVSGTVTTGSFDLSTGNYFTDTPSADVEYTFSNAGDVQSFQLEVTGAQVVNGFDMSVAAYDSKSFSVAGQETAPNGMQISSDGTKMFVVGSTGDDVNEYNLSTAYDVSTATYSQNFSVSSQTTNPHDIFFKPDGTKMYIITSTNPDTVYQYSLTTGYDISTASYDSKSVVVGGGIDAFGFFFSSDGTKMYIVQNQSDRIDQWSLSTAWDVSTATADSKNGSVSGQETNPRAGAINSDGTKVFVLGILGDTVYQYSLSTAYDISTMSYDSVSFSVSSQETTPQGLSFKSDGTKMYVIGSGTDTVYQYTTGSSTAITVTWDADIAWPSGTAPDSPANGEKDIYTFTTDDGGTTYIGVQSGDAFS